MSRYITTTHKDCKKEPLYVCILAGNVGYREKTKGVKVLTNVGDSSLLELQLKAIRHTDPNARLCLTVGFQADRIIRLRPEDSIIIENRLYEEENTAEEVRLLLNAINPSRLLLIDGATFFSDDVSSQMVENSSIFYYKDDNQAEIGVQIEDGGATLFSYGLKEKWSGLVYLEGQELDSLKRTAIRDNSKLCLHELLNLMLDKKAKLKAITSNKAKIIKF